jgi:hypothetical protein
MVILRPAPPARAVQVSYNCPTQCSGRMVGGYNSSAHDYITVFGSMLHMHRTGVAMRTQQMRDGQVGPAAAVRVVAPRELMMVHD